MCASEIGKNILVRAAANHSQQKSGDVLQQHCLPDDEEERDHGIGVPMIDLKLPQTLTEKMQPREEVANNEDSEDRQLNQECTQCLSRFLFHPFQMLRFEPHLRSRVNSTKVKCRCADTRFSLTFHSHSTR